MDFKIPPNISAQRKMVVEPAVTAQYIGSGNVEVLATPMMIALMEAASLDVIQKYLPEGWTTVGTKVQVEHVRASLIGEIITAEATLIKQEGRSLTFAVQARDGSGLIGQGQHHRVIINIEKFLNRLLE